MNINDAKDMLKSLPVAEASELMLKYGIEPKVEMIPVAQAKGRVLGEDIAAIMNVPPFSRSPWDGYALIAEDTANASEENPITLEITEELPAGTAPTIALTPGHCAKILTGAPVPEGATGIEMYERTEFTDTHVTFKKPVAADNIVKEGEDLKVGDIIAHKGDIIETPTIGAIAGQGIAEVPVYAKPVAAILTTGSELLEVGDAIVPGKIYNTNVYTIGGFLERLGFEIKNLGVVADDPNAIAAKLDEGLNTCDVVVTTGGASVGDYDFGVSAPDLIGAKVLFWKVQLKPGGSMIVAERDGKLVISLSGNPGSSLISLMRVCTPYLKKICGRNKVQPREIKLTLKEDCAYKSPRERAVRGHIEVEDGIAYFVEANSQNNSSVSSFIGNEIMIFIPPKTPLIPAGSIVTALDF